MQLALFGATGRTGGLLLHVLLKQGHGVRVLVRQRLRIDPTLLGVPALEVFEGDARDSAQLAPVLQGCDAALSALGMHDISLPATDFSDSLRSICHHLQQHGPRRLLAIASAGVLPHPAGGSRISHGVADGMQNISAEHLRNLQTLRDSGLDWTLMCPLMLVGDIAAGHARLAYDDLPAGSTETGYADLADTMARLLSDTSAYGRCVGIVSDRPRV